ncbi:MAG: winged helix-turn-helix transcriptional regulator [Nitrososphaerota archaeon]|nr:winged helix-turn-helix transcriptional regulator [Nitrososphaerota archaeon]
MGKDKSIPSILKSKGELTKFMILVEIFKNQPHIKQKDVGERLGITVQAVSKYFRKLMRDGMIEPYMNKAQYKLTSMAHKKLEEYVLELESYFRSLRRELKLEGIWPAIASHKIRAGERVSLEMCNGILYAKPFDEKADTASGVAINDAEPGDDVGLTYLKGLIRTDKGKVLIIKLPNINKGGSRAVDIEKVKAFYEEFKPHRIAVMGTVGRAVLNKLGLKADIEFGVSRASAFAALKGLRVFVLAVGKMVNKIIDVLELTSISYNISISYEVREAFKKL